MTAAARLVLFGATGRMGSAVAERVVQDPSITLVGSVRRSGSDEKAFEGLDQNASPIPVEDLLAQADVAIDFTLPDAVERHVSLCSQHRLPYVCGVTALPDLTLEAFTRHKSHIPVLWAPNMSPGVTICFATAADMARRLSSGDAFSVAITDIHHSGKLDAPSGTALEFGRVIAEASRTEPRISYDSVREGNHPGEHHIVFRAGGDQIELRHKAGDRGEFASGALRAASWLMGQPVGLYNMRNVLGITTSS